MIPGFPFPAAADSADGTGSTEGFPARGGDGFQAWSGCVGEVDEHRAAPEIRKSVLRASVRGAAIRIEGGFDGVVELCDLGGRVHGRILIREGAGGLPCIQDGLYLIYPVNEPARGALVRVFR